MCLTHVARRTKTCIAFVGPWWINAGEDDLFIPPKRFGLSWTVIPSSIYVFQTAKPKPAFSGIVGQSDRDTLLLIIRTHMSPGTRVMSDIWKAYDWLRLKDEGYTHLTVNHSLNFVDPDTGAHAQRNENTWWGVKWSMLRTGTSKDLFESYLQEWLWRQHYGDDPFAKTLSSISPTYMRKYRSSIVPLYALFVMWSPLYGGKKQNTQLQHMGLNWRKEIKRKKSQKTRRR